MDSAIYHSGTQKIFGVRGQWLFKCNAVTGVVEDALRFATDVNGVSSITSIGNFLYIGTSYAVNSNDLTGVIPRPDVDIYVVNAAAFVVSSRLNFGNKNTLPADESFTCGWRSLVTDGTSIYGINIGSSSGAVQELFSVDPLNLASYNATNFSWGADLACDTVNGVIWIADNVTPNLWAVSFDFLTTCNDTNGTLPCNGICYNSAQNKVYGTKGDFGWISGSAVGVPGANFGVSTFSTGRINANPYRIKSVNGLGLNPLNGKVLIPCWADDTVVVVDPLTDTVAAVKTGFTSPIDIVSTPTANFAVQSGITGLRAIV